MSSVHRAVAVRATLLLVLALVCGTCVLPAPAGPLPQPQQPRLQHAASAASAGPAAPTSSYETAYAAGGEADAPRGSGMGSLSAFRVDRLVLTPGSVVGSLTDPLNIWS